MTYEGWLFFVRGEREYQLTVRFSETGITGVRDTAVMMMWMNDQPADGDPMDGWTIDPYQRSRRDPLMKNIADDQTYDAKFPEHPLTLVRTEIGRLEGSLPR